MQKETDCHSPLRGFAMTITGNAYRRGERPHPPHFAQPPSPKRKARACANPQICRRTNMRMELPQSPSVTVLACGLGHAAALTAHWAVIHYRVAACGSLKEGACDMPFVTGNANLCGKERCFAPRKITRERNFFLFLMQIPQQFECSQRKHAHCGMVFQNLRKK